MSVYIDMYHHVLVAYLSPCMNVSFHVCAIGFNVLIM